MEAVLKKLGVKTQERALVLGVPPELAPLSTALEAVIPAVHTEPDGTYPLVISFVTSLAQAATIAEKTGPVLEGDGLMWLCYPKQTSKRYSADINRDKAWAVYEPYGMRPVAQISLDTDWSAMRFRRAEHVNR